MNALGGNCLEDFDRLREDAGLKGMLGHELPRPEAPRKFLYQFHDEREMERAQAELPVGKSFKREARKTYEATTGYQPVLALWAEMDLAVGDEFRDGNVPATKALLPVASFTSAATRAVGNGRW